MIWAEFSLTALAFVLAIGRPRLAAKWFREVERKLAGLARKRGLAILVVGLSAVAVRLAVLPVLPVPQPTIADEYSYLLGAETFASGRLTNPTPPLWNHFDTLHVLEKPTYMSMYPPAQALFLAAGIALARQPFLGVLLGIGLMCAAICWMLQGWFSPGWALAGGCIAVARFAAFNYWANSYWGGAVAALGGALVLGALPRLVKLERTADALLMGTGLALLANSRPYEGLVLSLPVAAVMLRWLWKKRNVGTRRRATIRVVLSLSLLLAVTAAAMGFYFWRVTGNPLSMPEQVAAKAHMVAPLFLFQSIRPVPVYSVDALREFHLGNQLGFFKESRTPLGLISVELVRVLDFWLFYFGFALTLPLILAIAIFPHGLHWSAFGENIRFLTIAALISAAGLAQESTFFPHYAAPMTGLVLALVIQAMRHVRAWRWHGRPTGRFVVRSTLIVCLLMIVVRAAAVPLGIPIKPIWPPEPYNSVPARSSQTRIQDQLESLPGKQLVFVSFRPSKKDATAFVYNGPNLDQQKVLWAWDMGTVENAKVIRFFPGRTAWVVDANDPHPRPIPYASPSATQDARPAPTHPETRKRRTAQKR